MGELGIFLAQKGRAVTILEKLPELSVDKFSMHTLASGPNCQTWHKIYTSTTAAEITETAVCKGPSGSWNFRRNGDLCCGTRTAT